MDFIYQAMEAFETRKKTLEEGGTKALAIELKEMENYKEKVEKMLKQ